ncbi:MAG: oligosaccharide flippase family protein [Methylocystis sp.]
MLVKQTALYFVANIFSAVFGFLNVVVFTRIFEPHAYGDYLLGLGFATLFATLLSTPMKFSILREQARGDGTDVSQTILGALMLCCLAAPLGYFAARLANLEPTIATVSVLLSLAIVLFDTSQEMLRAQLNAMTFMRGTMARAILVSVLGVGGAAFGSGGAVLLASASIAYFLSTLSFWRGAWGISKPRFDPGELLAVVKNGAPLTVSLSLLALAGVTDRFLLANLSGSTAAGDFGASFDLVRQALIIPAISVTSAFVPMTVQIHATRGEDAARAHLEKCLEILLAICLPACIGFALVSTRIADLALGQDFRQTAHQAMPYLAIGVAFQILNQQYMHTSFLLSKRNAFYLINTGSILLFNLIVSWLLIPRLGVMGAVWGRVGAELFGFGVAVVLSRFAFAMPFPKDRILRVAVAVGAMAFAVRAVSTGAAEQGPVLLLALIPVGVGVYAASAWLLDIGGIRAGLRGATLGRWRAGGVSP